MACNNESKARSEEPVDLWVDWNQCWQQANDTIVKTESAFFQDFIAPIDSIDKIIQLENIKPKEYDFKDSHRTHYYRNNALTKLVCQGTFIHNYCNEFYILDECNLMIRKTEKLLEFPNSIQRITTYALNRDSVCKAFVTSAELNYFFQDDITSIAKQSFEYLKGTFENELRLTEQFSVK